MRLGIDISQIVYETGVSAYTKNLVENLLKIDKENDYVLFGGSLRKFSILTSQLSRLQQEFGGRTNLSKRILPFPPTLANLIWNKLHVLPIETFTGRVSVFHSSDWTQPPARAFKVTTVHDLVPVLYPASAKKDMFRDIVKTHLSRLYWVKREVDKIIAVSQSTKNDLINHLKIPESKIAVIYEAAGPEFYVKPTIEVEKTLNKFGIHGQYLLTVGTGPRKNHEQIVRALMLLKPKCDFKLVVAGRGANLETRGVVGVSNFTNEELACLYTGAEALVYPSLYEGFGLPILEAFSCGCPVVTSNTSSMPEIAGRAAIIVDPNDAESISDGIRIALKNSKELSKNGLARAKEFSWEKCALETIKIYNSCKP